MNFNTSKEFHDEIEKSARATAVELINDAKLTRRHSVVIGCSTSEIAGSPIGTDSNPKIGAVVFDTMYEVFSRAGIIIAVQCCEHLNRALIIEREAVTDRETVNVVPSVIAGGAFATAAYERFSDPVALEEFYADAGLDIGCTLIGMHLKKVAVTLKLETVRIGNAPLTAARTRPKMIGGVRARYNEDI